MTIPLCWVDAFSDAPFGGNPAGVCLLDEPLEDERMQGIAFELGIAETAFLVPGDEPATFGLRWFSPAVEIDLCGHATLASAHALREWGSVDGTTPLTFHTRSGPLRVFGPKVGIPEDPATGSAQCSAGPFWAAALGRRDLVARQLSRRGATLYVRPEGERVRIAGHATTVLRGHLC